MELIGPWATAELVTDIRERALLGAQVLAVRLVRGGWEQQRKLAL